MKIIQVIPFLGMGGAETMCENLVYELKKLGHEVIVVSLYNKETVITQRLKEASVDVRFLDKKNAFDFSMFKKLKKLFKQEKPDVIHTHLYVTKYVFPVACKLKIKVVHTIHNEARKEATKFWRTFNKYYYKKSLVIPVALSKSIDTAPSIFREGLRELTGKINAGDASIDPYMDFAIKYPVRDSMRMMRLLYRLGLGDQERKQEQLIVFSRTISNLQAKSRETKYKERLERMEKKTMVMLSTTGVGVMLVLLLSILRTFTNM